MTQTYTVEIDDANGGKVSRDVVVTITGKNDAPTITVEDLVGGVKEVADNAATEGSAMLSDTGTISFADVDLSDGHTITAIGNPAIATAGGDNALPANTIPVTGFGTFAATVTDAATGDGAGTVTWTYEVLDSAIEFLAAGQTITQTYSVEIDDANLGTVVP